MTTGQVWPAEWSQLADPVSGARVTRLTNYRAHSHHLYFTNSGWYAGGKKLLISSDRGNKRNLYGVNLLDGTLTQLTDLQELTREPTLLDTSKNPVREEAYLWVNRVLMALDLETLAMRELYRAPDGFTTSITNATADGRYVMTALVEDLSHRFRVNLDHGYIGFREYWEARPLSRVIRVAVETGQMEVVWEERYWIGHINTSPTQGHLLTFCHEGPWDLVDNRIWALDTRTGQVWKIRPTAPGEQVGHEYWFRDGIHIGYHGRRGDQTIYGSIRYDNTGQVEAPFPVRRSWHFHSNALDLIVGDGSTEEPYLLLWRFRDGVFEGPRILAWHRGSFHVQILHVHPAFSPDGKQVLYTCDPEGYGQVHLVEVPDFESLPRLNED
ncbi:MAG: oligogalacturonate lyase family protein [Anaerolineae bacterium]|nr:oligogalacturonate lyase family protein [Anaerolineae bacterium]